VKAKCRLFGNVGQGNLAAQPKFAWLNESIMDSSGILRQKIKRIARPGGDAL